MLLLGVGGQRAGPCDPGRCEVWYFPCVSPGCSRCQSCCCDEYPVFNSFFFYIYIYKKKIPQQLDILVLRVSWCRWWVWAGIPPVLRDAL